MTGDIQHIIIIQSLKPGEKQTGQELYNDTISLPLLQMGERARIKTHEYADLTSKAAILAKLDEIHARAPQLQNGLVIHFEMHGSTKLDGLVTASCELLSWPKLIDKFRPINIVTHNQLYLTLATCNGRYLFEAVDFEQKSPYSGYLSASKDVNVVEIMDSFSDLYNRLLSDGNLIRSYMASEAEGGSFFTRTPKKPSSCVWQSAWR